MASGALTADQREEFRNTGLLRLDGAFPRAAAEAMGDRVWEFLGSRYGIFRGERSTWTVEKRAGFQPVTVRVHSGRSAVTGCAPRWTPCSARAGGRARGGGGGRW